VQPHSIIEIHDGINDEIVELFKNVQLSTNGIYPPQSRVIEEGGMETWLNLSTPHRQFSVKKDGKLVGYMEIENLAEVYLEPKKKKKEIDYWERAFSKLDFPIQSLSVIKRLVVHPKERRHGIGRSLLKHGIQTIQLSQGQTVALVVLSSLESAIRLYESEGATYITRFTGNSENQLHSYIF